MYFRPVGLLKTVTTAGTQEQLTTNDKKVRAVTIQAKPANTGRVYIGDNTVSSTNYGIYLDSGMDYTINAEIMGDAAGLISLKDIWLDVSVGAEGVSYLYLERED